MVDEDEIKIFNIPLRATKNVPRTKRAPRAINEIKEYVARHMRADIGNVWIDNLINERIWERGIEKPPSKIRVKVVRLAGEDEVEVLLPDE